jgi:hypothetical protein
MSISAGQGVKAAVVNAAFMSKSQNNTAAGIQTFTNVTQSTSVASGAAIFSGGIGIAKNLYVGGVLNVAGNTSLTGTLTLAEKLYYPAIEEIATTGTNATITAPKFLGELTDGGLESIAQITASDAVRTIVLYNNSGETIDIVDQYNGGGVVAGQTIKTGTSADISLADGASLLLIHTGGHWVVAGGTGAGTSSGEGGINYITNGTGEVDADGWATYVDAAGTKPVDGTGGGTPDVLFSRTDDDDFAFGVLRGAGQFVLTKSNGANYQGQGASYDFEIAKADAASILQISFSYIFDSGTVGSFAAGSPTADSDVTVWIYDVDNGVLIQPSTYKLFSNSTVTPGKFRGEFQTAGTGENYRLILHVGTTATTNWRMLIDDVKVAPTNYATSGIVTAWQSYTPTFTGFGTVTNIECQWRRVGSDLQTRIKYTMGTGTATEARVSFPAGITAAGTSAIPSIQLAGYGTYSGLSTVNFNILIEPSVGYFTMGVPNADE